MTIKLAQNNHKCWVTGVDLFEHCLRIARKKVLADISHKIQIIFFTHHLYILDLAKKVLYTEEGLQKRPLNDEMTFYESIKI